MVLDWLAYSSSDLDPIASATTPPTRAEPLEFVVDEATLSAIGGAPRLLANLVRCHTNIPHTISHPYGKAARA